MSHCFSCNPRLCDITTHRGTACFWIWFSSSLKFVLEHIEDFCGFRPLILFCMSLAGWLSDEFGTNIQREHKCSMPSAFCESQTFSHREKPGFHKPPITGHGFRSHPSKTKVCERWNNWLKAEIFLVHFSLLYLCHKLAVGLILSRIFLIFHSCVSAFSSLSNQQQSSWLQTLMCRKLELKTRGGP